MAALMERLSLCLYGYGKGHLARSSLFFLSPARLMNVMEKTEMLRGFERDLAAATVGDRLSIFSFEDEEEMCFTLVEAGKPALGEKDISVLSPLGAALLGALPGTVVNVEFLGYGHRYLLLKINKFNEK